MSDNYLKELFIDEVKGALNRRGGGSSDIVTMKNVTFEVPTPSRDQWVDISPIGSSEFYVYGVDFSLNTGETYTIIYNGMTYKDLLASTDFGTAVGNSNYPDGSAVIGCLPSAPDNIPPFCVYTIPAEDGNGYDLTIVVRIDTEACDMTIVTNEQTPMVKAECLPEHLQFGEEIISKTVIFQGESVTFTERDGQYAMSSTSDYASPIVVGDTFDVIWDGVEYFGLVAFSDDGFPTIGARYKTTTEAMPFTICMENGADGGEDVLSVYTYSSATTHSFNIIGVVETVKTIDPKYLPGGTGVYVLYTENKSVIDENGNAIFDKPIYDYTAKMTQIRKVCKAIDLLLSGERVTPDDQIL